MLSCRFLPVLHHSLALFYRKSRRLLPMNPRRQRRPALQMPRMGKPRSTYALSKSEHKYVESSFILCHYCYGRRLLRRRTDKLHNVDITLILSVTRRLRRRIETLLLRCWSQSGRSMRRPSLQSDTMMCVHPLSTSPFSCPFRRVFSNLVNFAGPSGNQALRTYP